MNGVRWLVLSLFLCAPCWGQKYVDIRVRPERTVTQEAESMAATPNYWQGGGDPTVAAAWSLGHTPTATEAAVADGRSHDSFLTNITGAGTGPDEFITTPDFLGDVGSPGAYYNIFTTNTTKITLRGPGKSYIAPVLDGAAVIVDNDAGYVEVNDTFTTLLIKAGHVKLTANANLKTHLGLYSQFCTLEIEASGVSAVDWAVMHGGTVINKRDQGSGATLIAIDAGEWKQEGVLHTNTTLKLGAGGIFRHAPSSDPTGNAPVLFIDGLFDATESAYVIPVGFVVYGPNAEVLGSIAETPTWHDYDARQPYP